MKKTSSVVWRFFDRIEENKRCVAVLCKLCDTQYKYFGNTTNLRTHLLNKHPIQWNLLVSGTLDDSTFRVFDDEDNSTQSPITSKRKKYLKSYNDENVDVIENCEADNEIQNDVSEESINMVRQMHGSRDSGEEWLNDDLYETIDTYGPKRKRVKYRTIKREVQTPPPTIPKYVVRNKTQYQKPAPVAIDTLKKDEYSVFGDLVANKLRKLKNSQARGNVQQLISTILWQSEYGVYDNMDTIKRVLLHSVQEMEVVHTNVEHIIVQEAHIEESPRNDEN